MVKRIILFGIITSLLQALLYNGMIILLWNLGKLFHTPTKTDYTWGLTILFSTYVLAFIVVIQNLLIEILYKKNLLIYFFIVALILFTLIVQNFKFWPLKTSILIISAFITLSIKFYLDWKINKSSIPKPQSQI